MPSPAFVDNGMQALVREACLLRHGGHVMGLGPSDSHCRYCGMVYSAVLRSTDPFVQIYTNQDVSIRYRVGIDWVAGRSIHQLPVWYKALHVHD